MKRLPNLENLQEDYHRFYDFLRKGDKSIAKMILNDWKYKVNSLEKRIKEMELDLSKKK